MSKYCKTIISEYPYCATLNALLQVALTDRYQEQVTYACAKNVGDHVYSNSLMQYTLVNGSRTVVY